MSTERKKPVEWGVLTSQSDLEISGPASRESVMGELVALLENLREQDHRIGNYSVTQGTYDDIIVLRLEVAESTFSRANAVTQNMVSSLQDVLRKRSGSTGGPVSHVEQMSQSLVPA